MKKGTLALILAIGGLGYLGLSKIAQERGGELAGELHFDPTQPLLGGAPMIDWAEAAPDLAAMVAAAKAAPPSAEYQAAIFAGVSPSLVPTYLQSPATQISRAARSSGVTGVAVETIIARGEAAGYDIDGIGEFLAETGYGTAEAYIASKQAEWQPAEATYTGQPIIANLPAEAIVAGGMVTMPSWGVTMTPSQFSTMQAFASGSWVL